MNYINSLMHSSHNLRHCVYINIRNCSMNMSSEIQLIEELNPTASQSGAVIFLHGSTDTGHGMKSWVEMLLGQKAAFPHLKILFPTAPIRRYTPLGGDLVHVWFDRKSIHPEAGEHLKTLEPMAMEINKLIDKLVDDGTPLNRIVVGGFSMGGAMACHIGYRYKPELAGVFTLSSFINYYSVIYNDLDLKKDSGTLPTLPPIIMFQGERDRVVDIDWGVKTFDKLKSYGVTGEFHRFPNLLHEVKKYELNILYSWMNKLVPEK